MHLIVLTEPMFPKQEYIVEELLNHVTSKVYTKMEVDHIDPSWRVIRPREIRAFDFTIPEAIEKDVVSDLMAHEQANAFRMPKIMNNPLFKNVVLNVVGLKPVDRSLGPSDDPKRFPVRIAIVGKIDDFHSWMGSKYVEMI